MRSPVSRARCLIVLLVAMIFRAAVSAQRPDPNQPDMPIDAKAKAQTIGVLAQDIKGIYVFHNVAGKLANMLEERQARGEYDSITSAKEFSAILTKQMSEIAHDAHLRVFYSSKALPPVAAEKRGAEPRPDPQMLLRLKKTNYGFEQAERLRGNVGYLKLSGFADPEPGGDTVAGAMAFLANTDALIIDLRENHGGRPEMVALFASYFFSGDAPVHLNDISYRKEETAERNLTQSWTLPYAHGKRYVKPVYILTSHGTPSAAEEFAYDLQVLKRATIVGETTRGGANPGGRHRLGDHFQAFIPNGQAINPVTKSNWEGVGITPDIAVSQEDTLRTAHRTALQHLIEKTQDEQELNALKQALAGTEAGKEEQKKQ
jgi:retinol-binding protein 3